MAGKRYLMAPGPTPVPPEVLAAGARPVLHHRGPDFRELMHRCLGRLREVCRTENDVLLFTASGSGAFESAVVNLLSPGERVLVVSAGEFGERWATLAATYGADVQSLRYEWGETPQPDDLRAEARGDAAPRSSFLVHSETSTGVVADVEALGRVAAGSRGAHGRRRRLEPRCGAARDGRVGPRRRRRRIAEGADDAARPLGRDRLADGVGARGALDDAALLLRLGEAPQGARVRQHAVHAGGLARRRRSTPRSDCSSRRGSRARSRGTLHSGAPAARARRRWASSSSRPTRSARRSSPRSSRRTA